MVERFSSERSAGVPRFSTNVVVNEAGPYVRHSDYAALEAELAEMKAEEASWNEAVQGEYRRAEHHRSLRLEAETRLSEVEKEVERLQAWKVEALKALEPFAWIGQWLFARDLPDDTPMVTIEGAGKSVNLTRGMFKDAHAARRLVGGDGKS